MVHFKTNLKIFPNHPLVSGNDPYQSPFHPHSSTLWSTCKFFLIVENSVTTWPDQSVQVQQVAFISIHTSPCDANTTSNANRFWSTTFDIPDTSSCKARISFVVVLLIDSVVWDIFMMAASSSIMSRVGNRAQNTFDLGLDLFIKGSRDLMHLGKLWANSADRDRVWRTSACVSSHPRVQVPVLFSGRPLRA